MSPRARRAFDYSIDTTSGVVLARVEGALTFGRIVDYASSLQTDPRFKRTFSEIVDLRVVESVHLVAQEVMMLADEVDPFSAESKRAFVVESQPQAHAAQLHQILRPERKTIRVFYSIDDAQKWIEDGNSSFASAGV